MKGFKVTIKDYPGNLHGDEDVYRNEGAARYKYDQERKVAQSYARSEEAHEVKFIEVDYEEMPDGKCSVGRVIHFLRNQIRSDLVRATALAKLDAEERDVLGL